MFRDVEQIPNDFDDYIDAGETPFEWIQSRERAAGIREEMETLFALFPRQGHKSLRGRLCSKHAGQFEGAWFEMQVFGILHGMGLKPRYEAPEGGADFRCEGFHVEATHVRGLRLEKNGAEDDVILRLRRHFDSDETPLGQWIMLESRGKLCNAPPIKRLVERIRDAIRCVRAADVSLHDFDIHGLWDPFRARNRPTDWDEYGYGLPVYSHPTEDWTLFVSGIHPASGDDPGGIDGFPSAAVSDDAADHVLNALRRKAKQLGQVLPPLYVAVQVGGLGWDARDTECVHAHLSRGQSVAGLLLVLRNDLGAHGTIQLVSPGRTVPPFEALREPQPLEPLLSCRDDAE